MTAERQRKIKTARNLPLEGLRGFLALYIMILHLYEMGSKAGWYPEPPAGVASLSGIYIVSIFFCVSGYLIVQSLLLKSNLLVFARNRIVRIYPVYLALQLIIFTLGPIYGYAWMGGLRGHPLKWLIAFVSNLFFVPGLFLSVPIAQKNSWSLGYEALFYVSAALLFFAIHRRVRALAVFFSLGCVALIVWRPLCVFFVVGYLAYLLETRRPIHGRWLGLLAIPALLLGAWVFPITPYAAVVPVFVLFYSVIRGIGPFAASLRWPPMLFLGRISFSLYLVHPFAIDPVRTLLAHLGSAHRMIAIIAFPILGFALAIVSSTLCHNLIEQKLTRRLLRRPENDRLQPA